MEKRDWQLLLQLYQQKSITKAAEVLFISQPTLTGRLQQIEKRFESQIVIRSKKGVHFTPEGKYLVECAEKMLHRLHEIENTIQSIRNEVKGTIQLGASILFIRHKLPDILKQFTILNPNVEFKVTTNLSREIVNLVHANDLDIGFIRGEYEWTDKKDFLFEENMYVVSRQEFKMENLPEMIRINYSTNKQAKEALENWWKHNFSDPPLIGMEVDKVDSCKEIVMKGFGYAFLPAGILDEADSVYKTQMIDQIGKPLVRQTWMIYREDSLKNSLLKTFVDFVNVWKEND